MPGYGLATGLLAAVVGCLNEGEHHIQLPCLDHIVIVSLTRSSHHASTGITPVLSSANSRRGILHTCHAVCPLRCRALKVSGQWRQRQVFLATVNNSVNKLDAQYRRTTHKQGHIWEGPGTSNCCGAMSYEYIAVGRWVGAIVHLGLT
jgi:hypothetical protein